MRIVVLGHCRHGKDTFARILKSYTGLKYATCSEYLCQQYIYPRLKSIYNYKNFDECFEDRVNHRDTWFQLIQDYNKDTKSRLAQNIFKNHDVCVGIRSKQELADTKSTCYVDVVLWIDASKRLSQEYSSSTTVCKQDADIVIENNGTLQDLKNRTMEFCNKYCIPSYFDTI